MGALVTDLMGRQAVEGLVSYHLNLLTAVLAVGEQLPKESNRDAQRPRRPRRSGRTASATSWRWPPGHGRSATRPAGFTRRAGGLAARPRHRQLLQDLPRVRRRRAPWATSPGTASSTTSRCTGWPGTASVGGPVVLGGRTSWPQRLPAASLLRRSRCRSASPPRRDLGVAPGWVEAVYPTSPTSTRPIKAGHFAAWEEPRLFSEEVRAAFRCASRSEGRVSATTCRRKPPAFTKAVGNVDGY